MTALSNRVRSNRILRLGLPLVALLAIAVALLVPTLGSAKTQAPQSAGEPTISGSTSVGDTLTGDPGTWAAGAQSYKYNWRRCPPDGGQGAGNCEGIIDSLSNQYTLQAGDVGFTIRLQVKAFAGPNGTGNKIGVETSNATSQITGTGTGPATTGLPTITGTAQVGQTLTASQGTWASTYLVNFSYSWLRCDSGGNNCQTFGQTASTYVVTAADQGSTLRVQVSATNPAGTTQVNSAQTTLVPGGKPSSPPPPPSPPPPTAAGCPAGKAPVPITSVISPARLIIDRQAAPPAIAQGSGQVVYVRYHVSDTCGQSVKGALVYATAVPFGQLSTPAEASTGANGYVSLSFQTLPGFPLGQHQRSVQIFVRARKQGEDLLAGISARRLFEIPVSP